MAVKVVTMIFKKNDKKIHNTEGGRRIVFCYAGGTWPG